MFKKFLKRFLYVCLAVVGFLPGEHMTIQKNQKFGLAVPFYKKILEFFLPQKAQETQLKTSGKFVYVSGFPIGFSIDGAGAVIVEKSAVITESGYKNPTENKNILIGDIIKSINGEAVTSGETISEIVNRPENVSIPVEVVVDRKGEVIIERVQAEYDIYAKSFRLGLWVRDNAVGVGMMTYVDEDGSFGSLGHPITDMDTGAILPVAGGRVYKCSIIGSKKGKKGEPGELKGLFLKNSNTVGSVNDNKTSGVYGSLSPDNIKTFAGERMEIALPHEVKMGPANIVSTVDGITPKEYSIEIVKTNYTTSSGDKCMVIRITDKELIELTGGIVQGMSGSPIVQDGKLIGCITHVFISDPEKGFASFITSMIE